MSCQNCLNNIDDERRAVAKRVDAIIERGGRTREMTIPLLPALQEAFCYNK